MDLMIAEKAFKIDSLEMTLSGCTIKSNEFDTFIASLSVAEAPPEAPEAPPEAPPEIKYEPTSKMAYSLEAYEAQGWTQQLLIDNGYLIPVTDVKANSDGTVAYDEELYKTTPKCAGATIKQFLENGWTLPNLIKEGYIVEQSAVIAPDVPKAEPEWPQKTDANEWIDSAGTIFNPDAHGLTKSKIPAMTPKGVFKKKRNLKKASAPAAPEAPAASTAPAAPAAPEAPAVGGDEDLDAELTNLISNWD